MDGWIKIHRKMLDNPIIMKDSEHLAIWIYLLLNATHVEYPAIFKAEKIMLQPGQLITGRKSIAKELAINESKIRRVLDEYEIDQQISRQRSNKNSLITILNWDKYQCCNQQNDRQVTNNRPTSDQQVTTNKNIKNNKNIRNNTIRSVFFPDNETLDNEFREYVEHRKAIKKPFKTDHSVELAINNLMELANGNSDKAVLIIQQSIRQGWQGLFELKDQKAVPQYKQFSHSKELTDLEKELLAN